MHTAVVKFNPLANTVGSAAEDDDFLFISDDRLIFIAVGGVVIRSEGFKFSSAGIDQAVGGNHSFSFALGADFVLADTFGVGDLVVGEPRRLALRRSMVASWLPSSTISFRFSKNQRSIDVTSNTSSTTQPCSKAVFSQKIRSAFGTKSFRSISSWVGALGPLPSNPNPKRPVSSDRSAFCIDSLNVRPMDIASPTDFICVVSTGSAVGNFSKVKRGTLVTT